MLASACVSQRALLTQRLSRRSRRRLRDGSPSLSHDRAQLATLKSVGFLADNGGTGDVVPVRLAPWQPSCCRGAAITRSSPPPASSRSCSGACSPATRTTLNQQPSLPRRAKGGGAGRERDAGARIVSHSNEDKPLGRPQAPDVCAALRLQLAPDREPTPRPPTLARPRRTPASQIPANTHLTSRRDTPGARLRVWLSFC